MFIFPLPVQACQIAQRMAVQGLLHNRDDGLQFRVFRGQGNGTVNHGEKILGYYIIEHVKGGFRRVFVKKGVGFPASERMVNGFIIVHRKSFIFAV